MENVGSPATHSSSNAFLTPLLISMAGIVSSSVALLIYHVLFVKYCARFRPRSGTNTSLPQTNHNLHISNGVDPKLLLTIPILTYSNTKEFRVDQTECVICLGELEEGETVRLLPNCKHAFHVTCIDDWFSGHCSCPICRASIIEEKEKEKETMTTTTTDGDDQVSVSIDDDGEEEIERGVRSIEVVGSSSGDCMVRHSISLAVEEKRRRLTKELTRSLSMDRYYVLVSKLMSSESRKEELSTSTSTSSSKMVVSSESRLRQIDWMNSRFVRSFSQIGLGRSNVVHGNYSFNVLPV